MLMSFVFCVRPPAEGNAKIYKVVVKKKKKLFEIIVRRKGFK